MIQESTQTQSPAAANQYQHPVMTEAEARLQFVGEIAAVTEVGSIGIATPMDDLKTKYPDPNNPAVGKTALEFMNEKIIARGTPADQVSDNITRPNPGWGAYGERHVRDNKDPLDAYHYNPYSKDIADEREKAGWGEQPSEGLQFFDLQDGRVDVRYTFYPEVGYSDANSRPKALWMGMVLPAAEAGRLLEAVHIDPSVTEDVMKAEALAIGVPEDYWNQNMAPRRMDVKSYSERELTVARYAVENPAPGGYGIAVTMAGPAEKVSWAKAKEGSLASLYASEVGTEQPGEQPVVEADEVIAERMNGIGKELVNILAEIPDDKGRLEYVQQYVQDWAGLYDPNDQNNIRNMQLFESMCQPLLTDLIQKNRVKDERPMLEQLDELAEISADAQALAIADQNEHRIGLSERMTASAFASIFAEQVANMPEKDMVHSAYPLAQKYANALTLAGVEDDAIFAVADEPQLLVEPSHPQYREFYMYHMATRALIERSTAHA